MSWARSLVHMTSSVSGWKRTMGRGELSIVSRLAASMLVVTESISEASPFLRRLLLQRR